MKETSAKYNKGITAVIYREGKEETLNPNLKRLSLEGILAPGVLMTDINR